MRLGMVSFERWRTGESCIKDSKGSDWDLRGHSSKGRVGESRSRLSMFTEGRREESRGGQ